MFSPLQWSTEVSSGASHVCTDPTRSSWFLKDFSNSKLKTCFFFSLTAVQSSPWSVYLLCPFKCRGYNLQSSCLKLISKTTVAFLLPPNMPNTSTIISAKSPWSFIYVYLEAWLFGLDNQTQVWCSKFQVKTTYVVQLQYLKKRLYSIDMLKQWFLLYGRESTQMGLLQQKHESIEIVNAAIKNASVLWQQQEHVAAVQGCLQ